MAFILNSKRSEIIQQKKLGILKKWSKVGSKIGRKVGLNRSKIGQKIDLIFFPNSTPQTFRCTARIIFKQSSNRFEFNINAIIQLFFQKCYFSLNLWEHIFSSSSSKFLWKKLKIASGGNHFEREEQDEHLS